MKTFRNFLVIASLALAAVGCDQIEPPYRSGTKVDTSGQGNKTVQKVLIEDFTGYRCGNCPAAADIAKQLEKIYPGRVYVLAIHSGQTFAAPRGSLYKRDFRTPEGEELFNTFLGATGGQPNGMINRATAGASKIISPGGWGNELTTQLAKEPAAKITVETAFSNTDSLLTVTVNITYLKTGNPEHHLALYLSEDSILHPQVDYRLSAQGKDDDDTNYVHMHMLRASIGQFGTWGESIGEQAANASLKKTYTLSFKGKAWKPEHCHALAILHDKKAGDIIQVEQAHVKD
jgi:hypothetical protein